MKRDTAIWLERLEFHNVPWNLYVYATVRITLGRRSRTVKELMRDEAEGWIELR